MMGNFVFSPNSGGVISIVVERTNLKVAPDPVFFKIDLSESTFDTAGPGDGEFYDPRYHDIIAFWDFDDAGSFTRPVKNLTAHKNANVGRGHIESHTYTAPKPASGGAGTGYNPSVFLYEPSSGKVSVASVEVFVEDPDVVFSGTKTVCINPVGDSDFSGKPTGAQEYNQDTFRVSDDAWSDQMPATDPVRFLFKGGEAFDTFIGLGASSDVGIRFGSYGTGRAKLNPYPHATIGTDGTNSLNFRTSFYSAATTNRATSDYSFVGIDSDGNFDPTTAIPPTDTAAIEASSLCPGFLRLYLAYDANFIFNDCNFDGFYSSTLYFSTPANDNKVAIDDCTVSNFGGQYPVFFSSSSGADTWHVVSGCLIAQAPGAYQVDSSHGGAYANGRTRAPVRMSSAMHQIVKSCDFFHEETEQPALKISDAAKTNGEFSNVHSNAFESAFSAVRYNGNFSQSVTSGTATINAVMDSNICCATHSTQTFVMAYATGITVRNNILYVPNQPASLARFGQFMTVYNVIGSQSTAVTDPDLRFENNTCFSDRTSANNNSASFQTPSLVFDGASGALNIVSRYNVNHQPSEKTPVSVSNLSSTIILDPRSIGRRNGLTGVLDTTVAPLTDMPSAQPQTDSSAIGDGAATGAPCYKDIVGSLRGSPDDAGAWVAE